MRRPFLSITNELRNGEHRFDQLREQKWQNFNKNDLAVTRWLTDNDWVLRHHSPMTRTQPFRQISPTGSDCTWGTGKWRRNRPRTERTTWSPSNPRNVSIQSLRTIVNKSLAKIRNTILDIKKYVMWPTTKEKGRCEWAQEMTRDNTETKSEEIGGRGMENQGSQT